MSFQMPSSFLHVHFSTTPTFVHSNKFYINLLCIAVKTNYKWKKAVIYILSHSHWRKDFSCLNKSKSNYLSTVFKTGFSRYIWYIWYYTWTWFCTLWKVTASKVMIITYTKLDPLVIVVWWIWEVVAMDKLLLHPTA